MAGEPIIDDDSTFADNGIDVDGAVLSSRPFEYGASGFIIDQEVECKTETSLQWEKGFVAELHPLKGNAQALAPHGNAAELCLFASSRAREP